MSLEQQIAEFLQQTSDKYRLMRVLYRHGYGTLEGNNTNSTPRWRKETSPIMMLKQVPTETESFTLDNDDIQLLEDNGIPIQLLEDNGIRVSPRLKERQCRSNRRMAENKRLEWGLKK